MTHVARTASMAVVLLLCAGCSGKRELPPPPDTMVDTAMDFHSDTGATDVPGDGTDAPSDPEDDGDGVDPTTVYLLWFINMHIVGSNVQLFVAVTDMAGNPITDLTQEDFIILEDADPLTVEAGLFVEKRPSSYVWRTLILFDTSGSILETHDLASVVEPVRTFGHRVTDQDTQALQVSAGAFDGAEELRPVVIGQDGSFVFTALGRKLDSDLDAMLVSECTTVDDCMALDATRPNCVNGLCIDPSTNLYGAVIDGITEVEDALDAETRVGVPRGGSLIVFTDGNDEAGRRTLPQVTTRLEGTDVLVFAIGMGDVAHATLTSIGRDGYWVIESLESLDSAMDGVWSTMDAIGEGIYLISYCTPSRTGDHTILVGLKDHDQWITKRFRPTDEAYCIPEAASTACTDRVCGTGDYDFYCGDCAGDEICDETATPVCVTACAAGSCGPSDTDPSIECGGCSGALVCGSGGTCCDQDCGSRECGPDPVCGVSCGECTSPASCDTTSGTCV